MLSFIYRLLTRVRKLDDVTLDMVGTFEEARVDALSRGRWNYFVFGIREISGLLGSPGRISKAWWVLIPGAGLAGLAIGAAAFYAWPPSYTAETAILVEQPSIPQNLVASGDSFDFDRNLSEIRSTVLSRSGLLRVVEVLGLYPHLRGKNKDMALFDDVRKAVRIERSEDLIRVAFTYRNYPPSADDPAKAARVTNELAALLIDQNMKRRTTLAEGTVDLLKSAAEEVASTWEDLNTTIRGLRSTDPHFDRLVLDRDLARKQYESLRQQLSDAERTQVLEILQKGSRLSVLEPAQVPTGPDVSRQQMELYGLGGGLLTGFIAWLLLAMHSIPRLLLTPEAAASD